MNSNPLDQLTVLVTRPSKQADKMRQAIESVGARVVSLPLIEIEALKDERAIQSLRDKVQQLDTYHILIFVSNNAVTYGGEVINNFWPQFPVGVGVIAIGPSTAQVAKEQLSCEVVQPNNGMTSEDILNLPQLQNIREKKIGIVRGQGGRELLAEVLRERGAEVDYLEAYSRTAVAYSNAEFSKCLRSAGVNVLTVSSGESLDRLTHLLADNRDIISSSALIAPSERVAIMASEAGYQRVVNAGGADPLSFVGALRELHINQE